MNFHAIRAIIAFELLRTRRTLFQSIVAPVLTTSLYFIVFGSAVGGRMQTVEGVPYGAFIVPGLVLLTVLTESVSNSAFGIYLPRFTGTIYELLSAPVSVGETLVGYVGAAAIKSLTLSAVILMTARCFVSFTVLHPFFMVLFLVMIVLTFCLLGFVLGLWAEGFEKLQIVPMMIIMPLTFLGGTFYSTSMLAPFWQGVARINPIVYIVDGFRWTFFGIEDVDLRASFAVPVVLIVLLSAIVAWMFRTGYKLRS